MDCDVLSMGFSSQHHLVNALVHLSIPHLPQVSEWIWGEIIFLFRGFIDTFPVDWLRVVLGSLAYLGPAELQLTMNLPSSMIHREDRNWSIAVIFYHVFSHQSVHPMPRKDQWVFRLPCSPERGEISRQRWMGVTSWQLLVPGKKFVYPGGLEGYLAGIRHS